MEIAHVLTDGEPTAAVRVDGKIVVSHDQIRRVAYLLRVRLLRARV